MKSSIEVDYIVTSDGKYIGWARDYKAVVVQADDLVGLRTEIMSSLKVLLTHFLKTINNDTLSVHCYDRNLDLKETENK